MTSLRRLFGVGPPEEAGPSRPGEDPGDRSTWVRSLEFRSVPLGDGRELVRTKPDGRRAFLSRSRALLLRGCSEFAPPEDQARLLGAALGFPPGEFEPALEEIRGLHADGFLISVSELLDRARSGTGAAPSARDGSPGSAREELPLVAVRTRDRPEALAAFLGSLQRVEGAVTERPPLLVLEEGDGPEGEARTLKVVRDAAAEGLPLRYVGPEERETFQRLLGQAGRGRGLPEEVVRSVLSGTPGEPGPPRTNRNVAMLLAAGGAAAVLDDDIRWKAARSPLQEAGAALSLTSAPDPTDLLVFPDRESLDREVPLEPSDLGAELAVELGRSAGEVLARFPDEAVEVDDLGLPLQSRLLSGEGRVRVTAMNLHGDSGMSSPHYYLALKGESRERLVRDREGYAEKRTSRWVLRAPRQLSLADGDFFMFPAAGLDASRLLPPSLPRVPRNDDGLWRELLRLADPQALIAHLPRGVRHLPPEPRTFQPDAPWATAGRWSLADLAILILREAFRPVGPGTGGEHLVQAGSLLSAWGASPPSALMEEVRRLREDQIARHVRALGALLDEHAAEPEWWARDVERALDGLEGRLLDGTELEPWVPGVQRLLGEWGELLGWWPVLWETATELNASGATEGIPRVVS